MAIDINRGTEGIVLPPAVSNDIWSNVQSASIVQQLGRRIELPGAGVVVPIITGDPEAQWVEETAEKPVSRSTFDSKTIKGYTLAVIEPFSNQFRRDLPSLYAELQTRLPRSLARRFDRAAFGFEPGPGAAFDSLSDAVTVDVSGDDPYTALLGALGTVVNAADDADVSAWALSPAGEIGLLGARDSTGNPLLTGSVSAGSIGQVLGRPVFKSPHLNDPATQTVGFAGDWASAWWGYSQGISISISDQSTLTDSDGETINLWQRNMFAVRVECEIGFAVRDHARFVRLTNGTGGE